jgi:hypothetical protein
MNKHIEKLKNLFQKAWEAMPLIRPPCIRFFKDHPDDEYIDKIEIVTVPRYKTSHLSGDEWRTSAVLKCYRKGHIMIERSYRDIDTATKALPWVLVTWREGGDPRFAQEENARLIDMISEDDFYCHQAGCPNPATRIYKLKKQYTRQGDELTSSSEPAFRSFCEHHRTRGDCGLEDADSNYEELVKLP